MFRYSVFSIVALLIIQARKSEAVWACSSDQECSTSLSGAVCNSGVCECPPGQQQTLGGTECTEGAPYYQSQCIEDFQCSRLFTGYQCSSNDNSTESVCSCQTSHHYFHGRCWLSRGFGETCTRDEECQSTLNNPYSMSCIDGSCQCSSGYYLRQRGECRQIGYGVGDGCVLDADCQFENGACGRGTLVCYNTTDPEPVITRDVADSTKNLPDVSLISTRQHGTVCSATTSCAEPFSCSNLGVCVCPVGYYSSEDGTLCLAELGSPSTEETCSGILAEVRDGVCTCPPNFYFDGNMRDCVKPAQLITDSCLSDASCHTFGVATVCGEPAAPWGIRSCECVAEDAVWDEQQYMCRLFAGLGEECEVDSDCLAGNVEVLCAEDEGVRRCSCPAGLTAVGGLCLTTGLELGESCQVSQECTGTENSECVAGFCACAAGYQVNDDVCSPMIGGACIENTDCVVENTVCVAGDEGATCLCADTFIEYNSECWPAAEGYNSTCTVDLQCSPLGDGAGCLDGHCLCSAGHHYRSGQCWPQIGLYESCDRSSVCYLGELTDRVVCRNGLCLCDFDYPYSEELHTCLSGASTSIGNLFIILCAIGYLITR